jgi:hypothetical protein
VLGGSEIGSSGGGGRVLARTSLTTQRRERTLTSWPDSGGEARGEGIAAPWGVRHPIW